MSPPDDDKGADIAVMLRPKKKGMGDDDAPDSGDGDDDKALDDASGAIIDAVNNGDAAALKDALSTFIQAM